MRKSLLVCALTLWAQDIDTWRRDYEHELRKPDGWLSLAGLHWLEDGKPNGDVLEGATFTQRGREVRLRRNGQERAMGSTLLHVGTRSYQAIERGGRFAIRVRDTESDARRNFRGLHWYPADSKWRVEARWKPYPAAQVRMIDSVGGIRQRMTAPGVAVFELSGSRYELEPFDDGDKLMFVFQDSTSRTATYPGGRFLYTDRPKGGTVLLDFNRTENPPCAYTPYATCPLAPPRNRLQAAVEAGEKRYHE